MSDIKVIIGAEIKELEQKLATAKAKLISFGQEGPRALAPLQDRLKGLTFPTKQITETGNKISMLGGFAQKAAGNIGALAGSLISGGLITAVVAAGAALVALGQKMFDLTDNQKKLGEALEAGRGAYVKTALDINKVKDAFEQAREGTITKERALGIYNKTLGATLGYTKDFNIAEENTIKNGPELLRYTILKAAANYALGKSAEAAARAVEQEVIGTRAPTAFERLRYSKFGGPTKEALLQERITKELKEQNKWKLISDQLSEKSKKIADDIKLKEVETVDVIKKKTTAQKQYTEALKETRSELRPFFEQEAPLSLGTGAALTPELVLKPQIKLEISPDQQKKVLDGIQSLFNDEKIQQIMDNTINSAVSGLADSFAGILSGAKNGFSGLFDGLANTLAGGLKEIGKYLVETYLLIGTIQKIKFSNPAVGVAVGFALQVLGGLIQSKINTTKAFATGVRNFEGGVALVGERGPEFVNLPRGAGVMPNNEVNAYGNGGVVLQPSIFYEGTGFRIMLNRVDASMRRNG